MAVETIGYAVLSGVARWQKIDANRMRVFGVTSIATKRIYVRDNSGYTSSRDIEELLAFRSTEKEAQDLLKLILDETREARADALAKQKEAETAGNAVEKTLRGFFEPRPAPLKSTQAKLQKMSTEDLEAELQRRKGGNERA